VHDAWNLDSKWIRSYRFNGSGIRPGRNPKNAFQHATVLDPGPATAAKLGGVGSKGAIFFHCVSVSNGPVRAIDPPLALLILFIRHFAEHNHLVLKALYWVMQQPLISNDKQIWT